MKIRIQNKAIARFGWCIALLVFSCQSSKNSISSPSRRMVQFEYQDINGIGMDSTYNRRDNSDIIKVGNKYYIWYTRMDTPVTSGYWGTIWYATSEDEGHTWTEQGMALGLGEEGAFDSHSVFTPNILAYKGRYYLYYTGVKPTPGNTMKEFENNSINDFTAIGVAVADRPDGPFVRASENPVLRISSEAENFDSYRIDDASLLVENDKIWLYYKGRSIVDGTQGPARTKMGVAFANRPTGPFIKNPSPILDNSHEVLVWKEQKGISSLASIDATINHASDGLHFRSLHHDLKDIPKAPGLYRPHLESGNKAQSVPGWGISMTVRKGVAYLRRFEMK
ncbi:glycosyl hydrolase family 43 [Dyadobacter jejuensis]|uniref:Glycosyl hydrolase family 43 n=1 Tax=Dyadobacter jejuensis TaxID=1082580 RepID=A0A316AJN9_9BACT|nr:family 43 glycosylhydrolase [Dyadobacter jejuensis]PWJ57886.1 glycosyl hydrolase family 43 [Dyadobacter jejuensis]